MKPQAPRMLDEPPAPFWRADSFTNLVDSYFHFVYPLLRSCIPRNYDWNGSVNVHHSFFRELHWQPRFKRSG